MMTVETKLNFALRKDLRAFVAKAFLEEHGHQLGDQRYIDYICFEDSQRKGTAFPHQPAASASQDILCDLPHRLVPRAQPTSPSSGHRVQRGACSDDLSSSTSHNSFALVSGRFFHPDFTVAVERQ